MFGLGEDDQKDDAQQDPAAEAEGMMSDNGDMAGGGAAAPGASDLPDMSAPADGGAAPTMDDSDSDAEDDESKM